MNTCVRPPRSSAPRRDASGVRSTCRSCSGRARGGGFAFAISLGEFRATIFIARPIPGAPVVIFRLLGQPGALNFGAAMAASVILMAVTAVAILAIERFRFADIGEF